MSMAAFLSDLSGLSLAPVAIVALRATALLALTALALFLVRRQSATRRHVIIVLGTAGSLGASVVAAAGLQWRVPLLPAGDIAVSAEAIDVHPDHVVIEPVAAVASGHFDARRIPREPVIMPEAAHTVQPVVVVDAAVMPAVSAAEVRSFTPPSTPVMLAVVWFAGFAALMGHYLRGIARRTRLAWRASSLLPAPWERACHRLAEQGRLPLRVRVLATEDSRMPMTWGVVRPTVLVPAWSDWSDEERDAALLHELAHVQRGDAVALALMTWTRAIHWFNPIAWWLTSAERLAREEACDDLVLGAGVRPSLYAEQLLGIVGRPGDERAPAAALAMARASSLAHRLCSILQPSQRRDCPGALARGALALVTIVLSACVGTVTPVSRAASLPVAMSPQVEPTIASALDVAPVAPAAIPSIDAEAMPVPAAAPAEPLIAIALVPAPSEVAPTVEAPAMLAPVHDAPPAPLAAVFPAPRVVVPAPRPQPRCLATRGSGSTHISSSTDDGRRKVVWKQDGCEIELQTRGDFTMTAALDDIRTIASGGYVQLREDDGKVEREVRATPGPDGVVQYDYRVDGARRPWDGDARAWFASLALRLDRRFGWAADVRVPALLQQGGVDAVLAEIDRLEGDYARRVYFTGLSTRARLTSAQLVRVMESASAKIASDYEMAELLIAVGKQPSFDDQAQRTLARATGSIASSYERRRALASLLRRDGLSTETVGAMLEASRGMESDYELAELLIAISSRYALAPATQTYFLDALATIESDYEYRRVFGAMAKTGSLSPASTAVILDHAATHMRGYELAELLVSLDRAVAQDRTLGAPFLRALRRVDSGYEKARVMKHLVRQAPDTAIVLQVLGDARTIGSSHERLQLLLEVSRSYRIEGALREAYLDAADSIDSDHERGQALAAITGRRNSAR